MEHNKGWERAVGEAIRAERGAREMTQAAVAEAAGMPRQSYIRYEKGERQPNVAQLAAIARGLGMTLGALVAEVSRRAGK
ncbi:MAG: helix-turn-helix domain-containing protein [Nocardioides sp.]